MTTDREIRQSCGKARSYRKLWMSLFLVMGVSFVVSVLPVGLLQTWASVEHGMWYARSAEFLQPPLMQNLRWLRVLGDTIFALGAVGIGWFVLGLKTGWSFADRAEEVEELDAMADGTTSQP